MPPPNKHFPVLIYSLFLLIITTSSTAAPPKFDSFGSRHYFPAEGTRFDLRCPLSSSGSDNTQVEWFRNDRPYGRHSPVLSIPTISRIDSDIYKCYAHTKEGGALSPAANVTASYLEGFAPSTTSTTPIRIPTKSAFTVLSPPPLISAGLSSIQWRWFVNEAEELSANSGSSDYFISSISGDLVVLDPHSHLGSYRVEVHSPSSSPSLPPTHSNPYTLEEDEGSVAPEVSFAIVYRPKDASVVASDPATFECVPGGVATSKYSPTIRWLLNGEELVDDRVKVELSGRRLIITNPGALLPKGTHSADVRCSATANEERFKDQADAKLEIFESPRLDRANLKEVVIKKVGESLRLACIVKSAWPRVKQMIWYFNREKLTNVTTASWHIERVGAADFGVYHCEAANTVGSDNAYIWLKPMDPAAASPSPIEQPRPSSIVEGPMDQTVGAGKDVVLICKTDSPNDNNIKWKHNGADINPYLNDRLLLTSDSLTIRSTQKADGGKYTCSIPSSSVAASAHLTVIGPSARLIEYGPVNQSVVVGSNLQIPCKLGGDYTNAGASITWQRNGQDIPSPSGDQHRRTSISQVDGSLSIKQAGPDNIGLYTCTIRLGNESQSASGWLRIIDKPSMPQNVQALLLNESVPVRVSLKWTEGFNGNAPITKYRVEMRVLGANDLWSEWETALDDIDPEECCSALVDNLKPSTTTANFRVIAFNKHGAGKPSLPSQNITLPKQPPTAEPRSVGASARSPSSIMVQWQAPELKEWNGEIRGYVVRYRLSGYTNAEWNLKNVSNEHARNALIEQLLPWRDYDISVAAYNDKGMGIFSKAVTTATSESAPIEAPHNVKAEVISSTSARVSFDPVEQQMIPGVNLGYKVEIWKDGNSTPFRTVHVFPAHSRMSELVEELEKFGHYNLTVLCFTAAGDGPRSEPIEVVTMEDVPGPVASINFDQLEHNSVTIQWEPPPQPNGVIQKYIIHHWESEKGEKRSVEVNAAERSLQLKDLLPSTHYTVDIRAVTQVGAGPPMEASFESGVTPELPGRPSSLFVSDVGPRSVVLQFVPGFDGHAQIKRWIVEAKVGASSIFTTLYNTSAPKARSLTVDGLRPFTKYQLRIIAENVRGRGAPSDSTRQFETKQTFPDPPEHVYAEPTSSTQIAINWTPLPFSHWNGEAQGYLIEYRPMGEEGTWLHQKVPNPKANDLTLRQLKPYTAYQLRAVAVNAFGRSNHSQLLIATTYEGIPSAGPLNVKATADGTRQVVKVTWDAMVESEKANGPILGYTIRLTPTEEGDATSTATKVLEVLGADMEAAEVGALSPFTTYKTTITAFTLVGEGPPGDSQPLITTPEDVPSPPSNVSFSYRSSNELRLQWAPPLQPNGLLLGYDIRSWRHDQAERDAILTRTPPHVHIFSATSLTSSATYHFAIRAETSAGAGPEQRVDVRTGTNTPPLANPPPPTRSRFKGEMAEGMAVGWTIPRRTITNSEGQLPRDEAPVRALELQYRQANEDRWRDLPHPVPTSGGYSGDYVIEGLHPNTAYQIRMRYIGDSSHRSTWSAESEWMKTLEAAPTQTPRLISAQPYESSSVLVKWEPIEREEWNSDGVGYRLLYRPYPPPQQLSIGNDSYRIEEIPISETVTPLQPMQHILRKLRPFQHYTVQIRSFNGMGASRSSPPLFVYVGYSIPKKSIHNLAATSPSSTSIQLKWDEWVKNGDDLISGYRIQYTPLLSTLSPEVQAEANASANSNGEILEEVVVTERSEHLLVDLRKYTEYQISVAGYNRAGVGQSAVTRVWTLEDVPGPVGPLHFHDILLDSVNVSWSPPAQPNGRVRSYLVNYRTFKLKEEFRKEIQERTQLTYLVAGGLEETVYYFSVRAETSAGPGVETTQNVTIGYNEGAPSPPTRVWLVPEQSSFLLRWRDGEGEGQRGEIKGHLVQARRGGIGDKLIHPSLTPLPLNALTSDPFRPSHPIGEWITLSSISVPTNEYRISYRQLEPASTYTFRLYSRNHVGVSRASVESEPLFVPASLPDEPFYTKWWFLTIVGLLILIVVMAFVAALCFTGAHRSKNDKEEKEAAFNTLQLSDGGIISYELHSKGNHFKRPNGGGEMDILSRPHTHTSWITERPEGAVGVGGGGYGSIASGMDAPATATSIYHALATDAMIPQNRGHSSLDLFSALASTGGGGAGGGRAVSAKGGDSPPNTNTPYHLRSFDASRLASTGGYRGLGSEEASDSDSNVDDGEPRASTAEKNFASHYISSNPREEVYRATWRKAREQASQFQGGAAPAVVPPMQQRRPSSHGIDLAAAAAGARYSTEFSTTATSNQQPQPQRNSSRQSSNVGSLNNEANGFSSFV